MCSIPCKSEESIKYVHVIEANDLYRKGHAFPGHALYRGQTLFFLKIWGLWVTNDAEFDVDFKNINLPR
jgi:hypothetical protein